MKADKTGGERREVVLVGGGHTHVQVLKHFAMNRRPDVRLTVILDLPVAVYSGMVPGFVAGQYRKEELEIDVVPLARKAAARVVLSPATGVDAAARRVLVDGRPPLRFDLASFDVGSLVAGLDLPGIREHAVPTRPIGRFVERVDEVIGEARRTGRAELRLVVVGGGVGGVELAFTFHQRLTEAGIAPRIVLLHAGERILPGLPAGMAARAERGAAERGIEIRCSTRVARALAGEVETDAGDRVACDSLVWVTGAASQQLFRRSGLPTDDRGFVRVRPTLQVVGHDEIFAAGDCAHLVEHPETPKAGVYAVRQGPYLIANLEAALDGRPLRPYRPQGDFLALLNLGDGTALGSKKRFSFEGAWVMRLKDWIDRRFMERFQVLAADHSTSEEFAGMAMDGDETGGAMLCGGCAAKVGQSVLARALARLEPQPDDPAVVVGLEAGDDVSAVATPGGELIVSSIDGFRPFTDDPFLVGRVAAVNAISDLAAKGVEPRWAKAFVTVDEALGRDAQEEELFQVLAGARAAFDPLGVRLVGGHTTTGPAPLVGFDVAGTAGPDEPLLAIDRLAPGQRLVLTKPLGTGVLFHADMAGRARGPWVEAALAAMARPNVEAGRAARACGVTAATDVTGFGLVGHLGQMLAASDLSATVEVEALPALAGARELLALGERSTLHEENARARRGIAIEETAAKSPKLELLFDPQTSGGLLLGVPAERLDELLGRLAESGETAAVVGTVGAAAAPGEARIRIV